MYQKPVWDGYKKPTGPTCHLIFKDFTFTMSGKLIFTNILNEVSLLFHPNFTQVKICVYFKCISRTRYTYFSGDIACKLALKFSTYLRSNSVNYQRL